MNFLKRWGPVILWCTLIFFLSNRQTIKVSERQIVNFLFFKGLHVFEYAILYVLWLRAVIRNWKLAFGLTILYAISDEIHQLFVPTREGRVRDVLIDGLGGLLGWWLIKYLLPNLPARPKNWVSGLLTA